VSEEKEDIQTESPSPLTSAHVVKDLYTGLRGTAIRILSRVERTDSYLEKLLDHELRFLDLSVQDKALLYEIVHGVVRWQGRLDWILSGFYKGQFSKAIPILKNALRIALYQILFLDKVPEYAAVNEAVEFVKRLHGQKPADISNAVLRNIIRNKNGLRYPDPSANLISYLSTYYSHPAWMVKRWINRHGADFTVALMQANNERPYLTLRLNTQKMSMEDCKLLLDSVNIKYQQGKYLPDFIKILSQANILQWQYFLEGYFGVQDESAGLACRLLAPLPGMKVLDLCSAPGGKSAYIANLMQNSGEIISIDRFDARLKILKKNLDRLGVTIVKPIETDAMIFEEGTYDAAIIDAPCSGFGTLSKKPDIKWKKELLDIQQLSELQIQLLNHTAKMINPGGVLVYSVCTIETEETTGVVYKFLAENPDFYLEPAGAFVHGDVVDANGCVQTYPHIHKIDGAFSARLRKKN
jgi:16S rRNA (cytosine967-C5)-methyltransferase